MSSCGKQSAELEVVRSEVLPRPEPRIVLLQALIREQKMDLVVEKGTELGVMRIVPVSVERSVVKLARNAVPGRIERWRRIALGAVKQCGGCWIPEICPVMTLEDALSDAKSADIRLVGSLEPDARPLRPVLEKARADRARTACILIGPEGDLTPSELAAAKRSGFTAISMGPAVLRAETAAIGMVAIARCALACS